LRGGLSTVAGKVTNEAVGSALGLDVTDPVAAFD
jgi:alanine dehydrogenase